MVAVKFCVTGATGPQTANVGLLDTVSSTVSRLGLGGGAGVHVLLRGRKLDGSAAWGAVGAADGDSVVVVPMRAAPMDAVDADSAAASSPSPSPSISATLIQEAMKEVFASVKSSSSSSSSTSTGEHANSNINMRTAEFRKYLVDLVGTLANIGQSMHRATEAAAAAAAPAAPAAAPQENGVPDLRAAPLQVDRESLEQIVAMGYPEAVAQKALLLNRMSPILALDWILQNEGSTATLETPLTETQQTQIKARYERETFRANAQVFRSLCEMGFNRYDVLASLRATQNNQEAACSWLLGERDANTAQDSLDAEDDAPAMNALPLDHPMVKLVLQDARIQAALANPNIVHALSSIAANPNSVHQYQFASHEISRVLMDLWRICSTNRHLFVEGAAAAAAPAAAAASSSSSSTPATPAAPAAASFQDVTMEDAEDQEEDQDEEEEDPLLRQVLSELVEQYIQQNPELALQQVADAAAEEDDEDVDGMDY